MSLTSSRQSFEQRRHGSTGDTHDATKKSGARGTRFSVVHTVHTAKGSVSLKPGTADSESTGHRFSTHRLSRCLDLGYNVTKLTDRAPLGEAMAWALQLRDLMQVWKVANELFMILLRNNEAVLRVALEIVLDTKARACLNWSDADNWYTDDRYDWLQNIIREKLRKVLMSEGCSIEEIREMERHEDLQTNKPLADALGEEDAKRQSRARLASYRKKRLSRGFSCHLSDIDSASEPELDPDDETGQHSEISRATEAKEAAESRAREAEGKAAECEQRAKDAEAVGLQLRSDLESAERRARELEDELAAVRQKYEGNLTLSRDQLEAAARSARLLAGEGVAEVATQTDASALRKGRSADRAEDSDDDDDIDELRKIRRSIDNFITHVKRTGIGKQIGNIVQSAGLASVWERLYQDAIRREEQRAARRNALKGDGSWSLSVDGSWTLSSGGGSPQRRDGQGDSPARRGNFGQTSDQPNALKAASSRGTLGKAFRESSRDSVAAASTMSPTSQALPHGKEEASNDQLAESFVKANPDVSTTNGMASTMERTFGGSTNGPSKQRWIRKTSEHSSSMSPTVQDSSSPGLGQSQRGPLPFASTNGSQWPTPTYIAGPSKLFVQNEPRGRQARQLGLGASSSQKSLASTARGGFLADTTLSVSGSTAGLSAHSLQEACPRPNAVTAKRLKASAFST